MNNHRSRTLFNALAAALVLTSSIAVAEVPGIGPLPPVPANPDNMPTAPRMALGQALFFDNRISGNGNLNCSSCHLPNVGWTLPSAFSIANEGFVERRNPPTLINVGHNKALIWDGRAPNLEKQAIGSTTNPVHKGQNMEKLMRILNDDPKIVAMFQAAYNSKPNPDDYGRALAVWQRHFLVTGDSNFDRYMKGNMLALSNSAVRGMELFKGKAGCIACHNGPNFTDSGFHNTGMKRNAEFDKPEYRKILVFDAKRMKLDNPEQVNDDPGRYLVTKDKADWKKFKTPTLRNITDTAPYMHDGRYPTLDAVIEHYNRGGDMEENQDARIKPLGLSDQDKADLKAFLESLWGPLPALAEMP
jgi:cytochrome c peroxidase